MKNRNFGEQLDGILIFGATGHIGRPLAEHLLNSEPAQRLRLASSSPASVASLGSQFPSADVVECNYYDAEQMEAALSDMEGVFVVTPDFTDEVAAMSNLVAAAKKHGILRHVVRITADFEDIEVAQSDWMPDFLKAVNGAAISHNNARRILDKGPFASTYLNIMAYYCDDLSGIWHGRAIRAIDTLLDVDRHEMSYVDPSEVGEAAANILLRRKEEDIGAFYHLHNEHGMIDFVEVAAILSEELGRKITYVEDIELWRKWCGADLASRFGEHAIDYFEKYFAMEGEAVRQGELERPQSQLSNLLGRTPKTLRQWVSDNKSAFEPTETK